MPRQSDKHGPRLDRELKRETHDYVRGAPVEPRSVEARKQEGPGDDEPVSDELLGGGRPEAPTLTHDEAELRAEIASSIDGAAFPARREDLIRNAEEHHARTPVVELLRRLPEDTYENVASVWTALGGRMEDDISGR